MIYLKTKNNSIRFILSLMLVFLLVSCKSKQLILNSEAADEISAQNIISKYNSNNFDFSTLYIKANAKYKDDKQSQGVTAEIKIKKNEKILVSVRFLGITMAKALITPNSVQYYEKINGSYFEGDYIALSKWLGTDLDYNKVQNMLLGKALDDLTKSKYKASISDKLYKLEDTEDKKNIKEFYFESEQFLVKKQQVFQQEFSRNFMILYPEYQKQQDLFLPLVLNIEADQDNKKTTIDIDYKSVSVNEEFTFPYSVPDGYERIYIK
jgi:hypothetical protein